MTDLVHGRRLPRPRIHATGQLCCRLHGQYFYFGPSDQPAASARFDRFAADYLLSGRQLPDKSPPANDSVTFSRPAWLYLEHCGCHPGTQTSAMLIPAVRAFVDLFGDQPVGPYSRAVATQFTQELQRRGHTTSQVQQGAGVVDTMLDWWQQQAGQPQECGHDW